jgi:pimeloyl-ACP methyl ester carboxylesterase
VHWTRQPGSRPPVVLLGGCGVASYTWDAVAGLLSGVEVVALDRPGLMGTPWPGQLPRLEDEVATLVELVGVLGGPVVVVAHSMAGFHAEALARLHPNAVSGLVLVESSVELDPARPRLTDGWRWVAQATRASLRWSAMRPLGSLADRVLLTAQSRRGLFDPRSDVAKAVYRDRDAVASVVAEQGAYAQQAWDLARLRETYDFPRLPVRVLTATDNLRSAPVQDQTRLAELLGGEQVMGDGSRHMVMLDRPDQVAAAVREVRPG